MRCTACDERMMPGDEYLPEAQGGVIHFACCGPERECFTKGDGEPLGPDDPIPTPDVWTNFDDQWDEDDLDD